MRRIAGSLGSAVIGCVLLVWTLVPIYNMLVMSISPASEAISGDLWPSHPTFANFVTVLTQGHQFLRQFWRQLFNSVFVAASVVAIVLVVASLASFAIARLKVWGRHGVTNMALLTYLIPAAFLTIPMYRTMVTYQLADRPWALILSVVTFATPYAILVLRQAANGIPGELDEAALIDGATPLQMFWLIYLPLLVPTLVAVGTYAFLLAWNEYLYALIMLSAADQLTVPVMLGDFLSSDSSPWNLLMATGLIYAIPPILLYYAVRRHMVDGLMSGAVKG